MWSWLYSRHHTWLLFVEGCSLFCCERVLLPVSEFFPLCKNLLFNFQFSARALDESLWVSVARTLSSSLSSFSSWQFERASVELWMHTGSYLAQEKLKSRTRRLLCLECFATSSVRPELDGRAITTTTNQLLYNIDANLSNFSFFKSH